MAGTLVFTAPPAPTPSIDAATLNDIQKRMTFGMIKAVIGSQHSAQRVTKQKFPYTGKDGKPAERVVDVPETVFREVRSVHSYQHNPKRAICLSCGATADDEAELIADHHAQHGGHEGMRKKGLRHVYALETLAEVTVHTAKDGRAVVINEVALLSDREPGNPEQG